MKNKMMCVFIFLLLFLKKIIEMLLFKMTLKPVSQHLSGLITIFLFVLAGCLLQFVFTDKKDRLLDNSNKNQFKSKFSAQLKKSAHGILFAMMAAMVAVAFGLLSLVSVFAAAFIAGIALYIILIAVCFRYARTDQTPAEAMKSTVKWFLGDPLKALTGFAVILLSAGCAIAFHRVFALGMSMINAPAVLAFVYIQLFTALICGLLFQFFLKTAVGFLPGTGTLTAEVTDSATSPEENGALQHPAPADSPEINRAISRKNALRPLITAAVLLVLSAGILFIDQQENIFRQFAKQAEKYISEAEALSGVGNVSDIGRQYRKAAVTYGAISAFAAGESIRYDKRMNEAEKTKGINEYSDKMQKLFTLDEQNAALHYFNGVRLLNSNDAAQAAVSLKKAYAQLSDFACVRFDYLKSCIETKDEPNARAVADDIVRSGEFTCKPLANNENAGLNERSRTAFHTLFLENLSLSTGIAEEYYESKLYTEAQAELDTLSSYLSGDDNVDRLTALVDLELKADGKSYEAAVRSAEKLKKRHPEDRDMLLFCAMVEWSAFSRDKALVTMKDCQMRFQDDIQVAEEYLNMLFESNENGPYNDIDRQAAIMADKTLSIAGNSWFSYWVKACLALKQENFTAAVEEFVRFSEILEPYEELRQQYDDYAYRFAYKYAGCMQKQNALEALEAVKDKCSFAYCYIQGISSLITDQYEQAEYYMRQLTENSGEFAKVRFTLGSIAYEQAMATQQPEIYKKAEAEYKASLRICPEDAYCWFSLGLLYDRMKEYNLSLGAMRKANTLLPYQDHRSDGKGVSYHSARMIRELEKYLAEAERS